MQAFTNGGFGSWFAQAAHPSAMFFEGAVWPEAKERAAASALRFCDMHGSVKLHELQSAKRIAFS
jgi:hypothetical protein